MKIDIAFLFGEVHEFAPEPGFEAGNKKCNQAVSFNLMGKYAKGNLIEVIQGF